MYRLLVFLLLFVAWMIFSGFFDLFHLSLGALSCAFVTWLSSSMLFEDRSRSFGDRMGEIVRGGSYVVWLIWQIVLANIHLLKLSLSPGGLKEVDPRIIQIETSLRSDFEKFLLAQSITLTPGTVTVKIEGDTFTIHAISRVTADGLDGLMEEKISEIFGDELATSPEEGTAA